jgi:hypothetical protein
LSKLDPEAGSNSGISPADNLTNSDGYLAFFTVLVEAYFDYRFSYFKKYQITFSLDAGSKYDHRTKFSKWRMMMNSRANFEINRIIRRCLYADGECRIFNVAPETSTQRRRKKTTPEGINYKLKAGVKNVHC